MRSAWTVTVLAADGGLREGRVAVGSAVAGDRLRATAVAINTARLEDAVDAVVLFLIAVRKSPAPGLRVMGERRLEEIIATSQKRTKAVLPGSDDPAHFMCAAEDFLAACSGLVLALDKSAALGVDFEAVV